MEILDTPPLAEDVNRGAGGTAAQRSAPGNSDFVTVLTSKGPALTKRWYRDATGNPKCEDYGNAKWFGVKQKPIDNLDDLAEVIAGIGPQSCLILGKLRDCIDPTRTLRRLYPRRCEDGSIEPATIEDAPHRWLALDIDSVPACDAAGEFDPIANLARALAVVMAHLPAELHAADCVWQWTSGAGLKPGIRLRLFFWLDRPLTGAELKTWLGPYLRTKATPNSIIDGSIFVPTQPIYAAAPLFDAGVHDPVPKRVGIRLCLFGDVTTPDKIIASAASGKTGAKQAATGAKQPPTGAKGPSVGVEGPADVVFDDDTTIAWAKEVIAADLAEHGEPTNGDHSDDRIYRLIGRLQDGDRWGHAPSRALIANLLSEHWAPRFDYEWIETKATGCHYQNDPGVGQGGSDARAVAPALAELWEHPEQLTEPPAPPASEAHLAAGFAERAAHRLRYVDEMGRWMVFDDPRWVPTATWTVWNAIEREIRPFVAGLGSGFSESTKRKLLSKMTIGGVEALTRGKLLASADQFDADPWLLNTPAGIVDLRTGELRPAEPLAYCTKMTATAPGGECPLWRKFLAEVTGGDTELEAYLQRLVGYSLIGQVIEHVLVFFYGTGGNGKGVFLGTLTALLGDYAKVAPIDTFTETKSERHPTDMAMLRGMRLVTAQETDDGRAWAESKIKALTGGDKVSARFMRQDFFEYTPQFTLLIAGNHKPRLRSVDEAMRRRLHLVPFTVTIPPEARDIHLSDKLRDEWPGILQWAIEGCREWQRLDGLAPPPAVLSMTDSYFVEQDALAPWLEERCILDPQAWTPRTTLYLDYKEFTSRTSEQPEEPKRFWGLLESHGVLAKRHLKGDPTRGYAGIALTTPAASPAPTSDPQFRPIA